MCGIAGWVGADADADVVRRMVNALDHRGPDALKVVRTEGAVLGAARLAIRDVARGHQPFERAGSWAVLNGEIYNADALMDGQGRTRCDTEAVLHAYEREQTGFAAALRGQFGVAVWDPVRGRLLLARDAMGQKPLYVAEVGGGLVFASELRAVRLHPAVSSEVDPAALVGYLMHDAVPAPRTILKGVTKLEPGELLIWESGQTTRRRFHDLRFGPEAVSSLPVSDQGVLQALDTRVTAAVRARYADEVPWGCLLSGGIDSSLVTLIAAADGPVKTFALGYDRPSFDESGPAREVARLAGTEHHELIVRDEDAARDVPAILAHIDEPLGDESVVPTWLISRFAREHVKVVLTGDGGDELFLGYPTFLADRVAAGLDRVGASGLLAGPLAAVARAIPTSTGQIGLDFQARRFASGLGYDRLDRHFVWLAGIPPALQRQVLSGPVLEAARPLADVHRMAAQLTGARDDDDRLLGLYLRLFLAEGLLVKVDRPSMAHGLEPRCPLLDRAVVELGCALPMRFKRRGATLKWALRRLAALKGLPPALVDRKKQGFSAPTADWLKGPLRSWMLDLLSPQGLARSGLFESAGVERLMREHLDGHVNHRKPLWSLLAFRAWEEAWTAS
ncbi:MAG: asparagine synthase (glutamine-hydrolyzing) [Myxococcota bacterium]|jgi:asparagine synthase (glutamine-hydrolysing)